jgi:hypothetical protein
MNNLDHLQIKFLKILSDKNLSDADFNKIVNKYFHSGQNSYLFLEEILELATNDELNKINDDYQDFPHKLTI